VGPLRLTLPVPNASASQGLRVVGRLVSLRQVASRTQEGGGRSVKAHSHAFPSHTYVDRHHYFYYID
jgi:hypothetical protein